MQIKEELLHIGDRPDGSAVSIPAVTFQGKSGPSAFLGITIHGNELTGQASFWRLRSHIEKAGLCGKLTVIPVMNPEGFNFNVRGIPGATVDLNRLYPGDANGSLPERTTAKIWEIARSSKLIIDLHTAGACIPFILLDPVKGEIRKRIEELAYASGITLLDEYVSEKYELRKLAASLPGVAVKEGIPSFTIELTGTYGIDWSSVEAGYIALKNVLSKFGILDGPLTKITSVKVITEQGYRRDDLNCVKGGLIEHEKRLGDSLEAGEPVANIRNMFGKVIESVSAKRAGYVVAINSSSTVRTGGNVATVAVKS